MNFIVFIISLSFFVHDLSMASQFDIKQCEENFKYSTENGRPKTWNIDHWRTQDLSIIFNNDELNSPAGIRFHDGGDLENGEQLPESHASSVLSIFCQSNNCDMSILASNNISYVDISKSRAKEVFEYNEKNSNKPISVISISMNAFKTASTDIKETLTKLNNQNLTNIIWSAGNIFGTTHEFFERSNQNNIVPVSAMSEHKNRLWSSSGYGNKISLTAPGEKALITKKSETFGATSGAAPQVASAFHSISKLLNSYGINNATITREIIYTGAKDIGNKGRDQYFGNGLINLPLSAALAREVIKNYNYISSNFLEKKDIRGFREFLKEIVDNKEYSSDFANTPSCLKEGDLFFDVKNILKKLDGINYKCQSSIDIPKNYKKIYISNIKSCDQLKCTLDALNFKFLVSNHEDVYGAMLCNIYEQLQNNWGIINYCSPRSLLSKHFNILLDRDLSLAGDVLFKNGIHPFENETWMNKFRRQHITDKDRNITRFIMNDERYVSHNDWSKLVDSVIKNSDSRVVQNLIRSTFHMKSVWNKKKYNHWINSLLSGEKSSEHSLDVIKYVLSKESFYKKFGKTLYDIVAKTEPESFIYHVARKKWYQDSVEPLETLIDKYISSNPSAVGEYLIGKAEKDISDNPKLEKWVELIATNTKSTFPAHVLSNPRIANKLGDKWLTYFQNEVEDNSVFLAIWIAPEDGLINRVPNDVIKKLIIKEPHQMLKNYLYLNHSKNNPNWSNFAKLALEAINKENDSMTHVPDFIIEEIQKELRK